MSYLGSRITREEFIKTRGAETTQSNARVALNMFDHFCYMGNASLVSKIYFKMK